MASDPTESHLRQLEPNTQLAAWWLVSVVRQAGYPLIITSSRRTLAEQQRLLEQGRSKTLRSAHLSGQAFDVDLYGMDRNTVPRWFWDMLGPWAEDNLGLVWGGSWRSFYDPGHFQDPRFPG